MYESRNQTDNSDLHQVYYFGNFGVEDLFREPATGKVFARQPASQKENGRYTKVIWSTSKKWNGYYIAAEPLTKSIFEVISHKNHTVLYKEKGQDNSRFPFSYEVYKDITEKYRTDLISFDEWHEWITENKPDNISTDNWIYGYNTYLEYPDIIPNGQYLENDLYIERNVICHEPTGKKYAVYELTNWNGIVLGICGYEYDNVSDEEYEQEITNESIVS